jgi:hypothetical protein
MTRRRTRSILLISLLALFGQNTDAHESPVDHVGRELRLWWADGRLHLTYRLLLTERAALLQLRAIDTDHNGAISDDERRQFFAAVATNLATQFQLTLDAKKFPLQPQGDVALDPTFGQTYEFVSEPISLPAGKHAAELRDYYSRAYPGPYRMLSTPSASAEAIEFAAPVADAESHPGMVIVKFSLNVPSQP